MKVPLLQALPASKRSKQGQSKNKNNKKDKDKIIKNWRDVDYHNAEQTV